jgi:hypothetical protein
MGVLGMPREMRGERWTPFGNTGACAILARDVNTFVCAPTLDGDRRFEIRFQGKIPL